MATTDAPNTTVLPEGALQPTTTEQSGSRLVISTIDTLLNTPEVPVTKEPVAPSDNKAKKANKINEIAAFFKKTSFSNVNVLLTKNYIKNDRK